MSNEPSCVTCRQTHPPNSVQPLYLGVKLPCSICLDEIPTDNCWLLPCGHSNCKECLRTIGFIDKPLSIPTPTPTPTPTPPETLEPTSQNIVNDYDYLSLSTSAHSRYVHSPIRHNPNLTMEDILDTPDKPWNWYYDWSYIRNPNLTMEDINDNHDIEIERNRRDSESERKWREKDRHKRMKQAQRLKLKDRKRRYMIPNNIQRHQKKEKKRYGGRY